jgi:putative DNA primase/helicase
MIKLFCQIGTARLMMAVNELPRFTDSSSGIWRKLTVLPFTQQFTGVKADKKLMDAFRKEMSGIFNWAMRRVDQIRAKKILSFIHHAPSLHEFFILITP